MINRNASSGHKLGQLIGDWYEEYFVLPLLQEVGKNLRLFVDSRFVTRTVGHGRVLWDDLDGNCVSSDTPHLINYFFQLTGQVCNL
ncbi:MAG: hypothetical protein D3903_06660 [Candidatus Electrothrix sp. GM3_4]|nr:hypothetical protein [Candidatus Electrothrix sp. GM3_4]